MPGGLAGGVAGELHIGLARVGVKADIPLRMNLSPEARVLGRTSRQNSPAHEQSSRSSFASHLGKMSVIKFTPP